MSHYSDLKNALTSANASADALNADLTQSQSDLSSAQDQIANLTEQLAACEENGPTPPDPSPFATLFGSSDNANVPGYNKVASARKYYGGQIESTVSGSVQGMIDHATHVLWVSFKALPGTGTNTPLDKFLQAMENKDLIGIETDDGTVTTLVTIYHEPENDGGDPSGGHNLSEYNKAYEQARVIVDRYGWAALGPVRMNSKPADLNNKYWPTSAEMDFDGWDCYYQGIQCPPNYNQTGADVFAKILQSRDGGGGLNATHKYLAVGETGIGRIGNASATDPKRIQRTKEMRAALSDSGHTFLASWWNAKNDSQKDQCNNPTGCQFVDKQVADAWLVG